MYQYNHDVLTDPRDSGITISRILGFLYRQHQLKFVLFLHI